MTVRLEITAKPGARIATIVRRGDAIQVAVRARAVDGAANEAILAAVARWLNIARTRVTLLRGANARRKLLAIDGIDAATLATHIAALPLTDQATGG